MRGNWIKFIAELIAEIIVFPLWVLTGLNTVLFGQTYACMTTSQHVARFGGYIGIYLRRAIMKRLLRHMGSNVAIGFGTVLTKHSITIGNSVYIGSYCVLGDVRIGDNTLIGDHVCIPSGKDQHRLTRIDIPIKDQGGIFQTINIGNDCWIGSGAIIMADVGNHCVVGAGSVVTKPIPDYQIAAGNPANAIGNRLH